MLPQRFRLIILGYDMPCPMKKSIVPVKLATLLMGWICKSKFDAQGWTIAVSYPHLTIFWIGESGYMSFGFALSTRIS